MADIFVAIDLGAESGRVVALVLDEDKRIDLHEAHRFATHNFRLPSGLHWDVGDMWREIQNGLVLIAGWAQENGHQVRSIGVDTWGVDWALIDGNGEMLGLPHAYRDARNKEAYEAVLEKFSPEEIYSITGIQLMPINSLYSLFAMSSHSPDLLAVADQLMFMPDLFHYFLSGQVSIEATIASTSQMLDIQTGHWSEQLLGQCEIPTDIFSDPIPPGTPIGKLRKKVARQCGLEKGIQVVAPASHDTASAVAAIPARPDSSWCFISSGTWSLVGAELSEPCANAEAAEAMFTNEAGVDGTTRFLKNIAGLWLVQQCRRAFASRGNQYTYEELTNLAETAEPFRTLVDPDYEPFSVPGKILDKINQFAEETDQPIPETPGDYLRCCLESLAFAYRQTIERMEKVLDRKFDVIHVVGGGGKNDLLNQMTADACQLPVVVGPFEATALGNGLVQAMAQGSVNDLNHLREIVRDSVSPTEFQPHDAAAWHAAYEAFQRIRG